MYSCKHATTLMSKKLETRLSFREWVWLYTHLALCANCRRCYRQFKLLDKANKSRRAFMQNIAASQASHITPKS
ncbi:anti-sigma factor family protein [Nitrincola alkalisediminis]